MADSKVEYKGLGRRKTSVARVCMTPGKGEITVNNRKLNDYFPNMFLIQNLQREDTKAQRNEEYVVPLLIFFASDQPRHTF